MINYEQAKDFIQESIKDGTMTMEFANELNDAIYDKYVTEASALSKAEDKLSKAYIDIEKKIYTIVGNGNMSDADKKKVEYLKSQQDALRAKARSMGISIGSLSDIIHNKEVKKQATQKITGKNSDERFANKKEIMPARKEIKKNKEKFLKAINESTDADEIVKLIDMYVESAGDEDEEIVSGDGTEELEVSLENTSDADVNLGEGDETPVEESTNELNPTDAKLHIYEAADAGYLTDEEKDYYLNLFK
jgi:polyhydroxyalkanoate synthesis regulator phasin